MGEIKVEIWKDIEDFPNYQISNYGRLRNLDTGNIVKPYFTDEEMELKKVK